MDMRDDIGRRVPFELRNVTVTLHFRRRRTGLGSGGRAVERRTVNQGNGGSIPPSAVSKIRQFLHPTFACVFRKRH